MRKRTVAGGANLLLSLVLLGGVLALVNYLASRHSVRRDWTAAETFTLSEQTKRVLSHLDRDVEILSFFRTGDPAAERMKDLVQMYDDLSRRVSFELVDPDRQPGRASRYRDIEYGMTVVDAGSRTERVDEAAETRLTNAIIQATRDERKTIAFLTGHGERDLEAAGEEGYSNLRARLENEGYAVETLNLGAASAVPAGVRVVVLAGAEKELLPNETATLATWLAAGGALLLLADPPPKASHAELVTPYGLTIENDLVIDVSGVGRLFGADEFLPMGLEVRPHPLVEGFKLTTVFPEARTVRAAATLPSGVEATEIIFTAEASWAETHPERRPYEPDPDDRQGPLCLVAAASRPLPGTSSHAAAAGDSAAQNRTTRVVVAGDSDFCADGFSNFGGNLDLAMNAVSWLAEEEDLIAIRPREREDRRVSLTEGQAAAIRGGLLLFLPLSVIGLGIGVWWRRR